MKNEEEIKVRWSDCRRYNSLFHITYRKMHEKFYPHFCGREEDVKQEMLLELIHSIKRIKKGEIKSERNYVITALKYKCYKLAKKYIDQDKSTRYLEDIKLKDMGYELTWEDLFPSDMITYDGIFSCFKEWEEQYMVHIVLGTRGYTRRKLREKMKCSWPKVIELEDKVKKDIVESIKRRTSNA